MSHFHLHFCVHCDRDWAEMCVCVYVFHLHDNGHLNQWNACVCAFLYLILLSRIHSHFYRIVCLIHGLRIIIIHLFWQFNIRNTCFGYFWCVWLLVWRSHVAPRSNSRSSNAQNHTLLPIVGRIYFRSHISIYLFNFHLLLQCLLPMCVLIFARSHSSNGSNGACTFHLSLSLFLIHAEWLATAAQYSSPTIWYVSIVQMLFICYFAVFSSYPTNK